MPAGLPSDGQARGPIKSSGGPQGLITEAGPWRKKKGARQREQTACSWNPCPSPSPPPAAGGEQASEAKELERAFRGRGTIKTSSHCRSPQLGRGKARKGWRLRLEWA